ncbi:MAG: CHASE domain-containing protein, partial [Planctomycetaceae bacterium]
MATDNDRRRGDKPSASGHPGYSRNATIVLLLGLLTTGITTWYLHRVVHNKDIDRFQNNVASTQDVIADRLDVYISLLRSAAAFFAASERVTSEQFRAYVDRLEVPTAFPGIQGIGFSRYVPAEKLADFTKAVRDEGSADFRVWPEGDRPGYYPILYLEPLDRRNQAAIGYDMFTESSRQAAMSKARDTGRPTASGKVTLVQEIEKHKQAGFLVYVPVYAGGSVPSNQEKRRKQLMGFVYSPFRAGDLLTGVFSSDERPRIDFTIFDGESMRDSMRLYESGTPANPRFSVTKRMLVAGRPWTLTFATRPEFEAVSSKAFVPGVFLTGTLLSLLIAGITRLEARARHDAEATEARQEFLIKLDDAVRPLDDPEEITAISARLLGEYLQVQRCAYADVEDDQDTFNLTGDYNNGVESIVGRYRFTQFGESALVLMRANQPYVVSDITTDERRPI